MRRIFTCPGIMVRLMFIKHLPMIYSTPPRVAVSSSRNNDSLHRTQTFAARFRSVGVVLAVAVVCSIVLFPLTSPAQTATGATWNNTGTEWTSGTSWVGSNAPTNSSSLVGNIATFSNATPGFNTVNLSSGRSIYGLVFVTGANAYTFTGSALTNGSGGGISNASASLQTFSNRVINNGSTPAYGSYAGGSLLFAGGIDLTTPTSTASRTLTLGGSGDITVSGSIATGVAVTNPTGGNLSVENTALTILSGNNTYLGTTTVSSGATLRLGSATALGTTNGGTAVTGALDLNGQTIGQEALSISGTGVSSSGVVFNTSASAASWSGTITPSGDSTIKATNGSITLSGGIDLNNNTNSSRTLTLQGTGGLILSGNISNSFAGSTGNIAIAGTARNVTLSGNNSYNGTTTLSSGGGMNINSANAISTNTFVIGSTAFLNNTSGGALTNLGNNNITLADTLTFGTSGSTATSSLNLGTGTVTASSSRTITIAGTNVTLGFGTLDSISSSSARTFTATGAGNTLSLAGWKIQSGSTNNVNAKLEGTANWTITGPIVNGNAFSNGVQIDATGLTTFGGNNTYDGATIVSSGARLRLGSATALGATNGGTTISSGGALDLNGQTIGAEALTISGTGVSSSGAIFNSSASAATWSGNITPSAGSTIKATSGSITLSGGIDLNNNSGSSRTLTLDGTSEIIVSGNISNSFAGSTGSLTKTGIGTVTLSGANTYSGTTEISAGTLRLSGTSALSTNGVIFGSSSAANNSTLQLAGGGNYVLSAFGSTNENGNNIDFTNSSGSAATLTFTAATNYVTRSSDNAGGRTVANNSTNLGVVFNGAVDIGSTTSNNVTFAGAGNTTVKGVIFNTNTAVVRGLTKTGIGILSLEGANSYNGPTTVSAGSLIVASSGSLSSSAVSISNGATFRYNGSSALASTITVGGDGSGRAVLGGTGTINSAVALNSTNDVLSPGNSPGIQNFTPSQTWSSFTYDWELNNFTGTTAGTAFDQISIAGALNLSGSNYTLNVISLTAGNVPGNVPNFTEVDTSWTILVASGGISGFDSAEWLVDTNSFSALGSIAGRFTISQSANNLNLNYVVPEPSTYALLGVSALACGAWFVRRRRKS